MYIPERPGRRDRAAPALSLRLHREAIAGAVDPVTAISGEELLLPKEGRVASRSRKLDANGGAFG